MPSIEKACPLFASLDIAASVAWYVDKLGFKKAAQYGDDYGIVVRDKVELHFWPCKERHIAENTSAYFVVRDVDGLYADMKKTGPDVRMTEPESQDYGMREFHVWDPDGNLLRFGEPVKEG